MDTQCHDILAQIFGYLPLKNIIDLESVCKKFKKVIRSHQWNVKIRLCKVKNIEFVVKNYNFMHYDFSYTLIEDDLVEKLGNCVTLDLTWCVFITNGSVKHLNKCKNVILDYCPKISNCKHLLPQNINGDFIDQLVDYYVKAVKVNNLEIIKYIHNFINNNGRQEMFIPQIFKANVIKIAINTNNLRMVKHIETYINYLRRSHDLIFISNIINYNINDPIIDAAYCGDLTIFKHLHSVGYNIHTNKNRPIEIAIENNYYDIVKYILEADKELTSIPYNFIHLSIKYGHEKITKLLTTRPTYGIKIVPQNKICFGNTGLDFNIVN
ncbi:putative ankyrin repeat protein [Tupanvirus soda lake]|uniref:Ankyrin repeat protein n=2 Tax=Tupanvirus TaxID=2094720 RepID=A0AC62ADW6_9VIRU|nr:putative ankyrin repeat protein [Tupanvirus soda lake]QKU35833.1 putative ankyrin repeat protein [Tupanvirus soda lake]